MKIAVIAASGRSGQAFVAQALAAGHTIRAGVRKGGKLPQNPKLTEVKCEATNARDLTNLLKGCDAVVSLIGHVRNSPSNVQVVSTKLLIEIMKKDGPKRLVTLTGTGVRYEGDKVTLMDRFLNFGVGVIDPKRVTDGREAAKLIQNSGLDWTIVRVLKLQSVPPKPFKLSPTGPTKTFLGRVEVAQAILEVLAQKSFIGQAPIISKS